MCILRIYDAASFVTYLQNSARKRRSFSDAFCAVSDIFLVGSYIVVTVSQLLYTIGVVMSTGQLCLTGFYGAKY